MKLLRPGKEYRLGVTICLLCIVIPFIAYGLHELVKAL